MDLIMDLAEVAGGADRARKQIERLVTASFLLSYNEHSGIIYDTDSSSSEIIMA